jgi:uncharacterized membrane protein
VGAGERDAEPAGEEHAAGEHDLEDLEPRQEEEGGVPFRFRFVSYFSFVLLLASSTVFGVVALRRAGGAMG